MGEAGTPYTHLFVRVHKIKTLLSHHVGIESKIVHSANCPLGFSLQWSFAIQRDCVAPQKVSQAVNFIYPTKYNQEGYGHSQLIILLSALACALFPNISPKQPDGPPEASAPHVMATISSGGGCQL